MSASVTVRCARRAALCLGLALLTLILAALSRADEPIPPRPDRYLMDHAGVFAPARASALNEKLAGFERTTSSQIVVYIDRKVPDKTTLEEFGVKTLRAWGVGQKGLSNGLIFFVFTDDRKMRVEVGYGLEGAIPDARAHRITDELVKPHFRTGDFATGVEAGVDALMAAARGEPYAGTGLTAAERAPRPLWPLIFILSAATFFVSLFLLALRSALRHDRASEASASSVSPGFVGSTSGSSSESSSSSSDSSSSPSSDFSGGGGDGGGGGSSDSW